ncbi:MAG TPA: alanine racemase [Armatimonadota bacterium]|nr:alanine racemase [Armatimonadota bacterium]
MTTHRDRVLAASAEAFRTPAPQMDEAMLRDFVARFLGHRDTYLSLAARHGTPLYLFDPAALRARAAEFARAFAAVLPSTRVYYAVKSNNHPAVAREVAHQGLGLDVSSGVELAMAIECGATDIVFSGPGKTDAELTLAVEHADRVTVLMDSFAELHRLEHTAGGRGRSVRAGIRITNDERGLWRKFGIPLDQLPRLYDEALGCSYVQLRGLQFHSSWNLDPTAQVAFIERLGQALAALPAGKRRWVEFIDIGGGFWPPSGEWLQRAGTPVGRIEAAALGDGGGLRGRYCLPAQPIETFAEALSSALGEHVFPHIEPTICLEPGRWLSHEAMHLLLSVVDCKSADLAITDGGTNAIGWERFEVDYFPVINLSRPALVARECMVLGSLCTPHDVWGDEFFGEMIGPGDVLLIPTQGAYTYSLRQEFIKPIPKVVSVETGEAVGDAAGRP